LPLGSITSPSNDGPMSNLWDELSAHGPVGSPQQLRGSPVRGPVGVGAGAWYSTPGTRQLGVGSLTSLGVASSDDVAAAAATGMWQGKLLSRGGAGRPMWRRRQLMASYGHAGSQAPSEQGSCTWNGGNEGQQLPGFCTST
jgi:hypothetical protein